MTKQDKISKILNQLKHLKQYKNKSEAELFELAKNRYQEELVDLGGLAITPKEKKQAKNLLSKYLSESEITSYADRSDLAKLIDLEILHLRFQAQLNKYYNDHDKATPLDLVEAMHDNIGQSTILKRKLGLVQDEKEGQDPLKVINQLKARFKKYINEHKDLFTMKCPHCGLMTLIRRRIPKDFEILKYPFLKGTILYNEKLFDLVIEKKITADEASKVLDTSPDYILWAIEKHYKKEKNAGEIEGRRN